MQNSKTFENSCYMTHNSLFNPVSKINDIDIETDYDVFLKTGVYYYEQKDYKTAMKCFNVVIENISTPLMLGIAYKFLGYISIKKDEDYETAIEYFTKSINSYRQSSFKQDAPVGELVSCYYVVTSK